MHKRTGASPSCLRVSHDPCLQRLIPSVSLMRGECGRFPIGRLDNANRDMTPILCTAIVATAATMVNRKWRRLRLSRWRSGAPLESPVRARSDPTAGANPERPFRGPVNARYPAECGLKTQRGRLRQVHVNGAGMRNDHRTGNRRRVPRRPYFIGIGAMRPPSVQRALRPRSS
jgi:hypothetical protein